ncbi:MAG: nitroreductase/quinone reductase family protein [Actinopolymorphaceae bacterium]
MSDQPTFRYLAPAPGGNPIRRAARWLTGHGVSLFGSRLLRVRGRTSGELRTTLVNLLEVDGVRYLVAPRGHTQWVRNLRAAGSGELALGRRVTPVSAEELSDDAKIPILRAYLKRFGWEVGMFFDNLNKNSPDEDLRKAATGFPVFRLSD